MYDSGRLSDESWQFVKVKDGDVEYLSTLYYRSYDISESVLSSENVSWLFAEDESVLNNNQPSGLVAWCQISIVAITLCYGS